MERKEEDRTNINIVRIRIIVGRIFGEPDADLSIEVPEKGEIEREVGTVPEGVVSKTKFEEYHCRGHISSPRSFPAVMMGSLYMLWIVERGEWVGIKYEDRGWDFQGTGWGVDENIHASGPFRLNDVYAGLILRAYDNPHVPINKVLHTSPIELEELAHNSS